MGQGSWQGRVPGKDIPHSRLPLLWASLLLSPRLWVHHGEMIGIRRGSRPQAPAVDGTPSAQARLSLGLSFPHRSGALGCWGWLQFLWALLPQWPCRQLD